MSSDSEQKDGNQAADRASRAAQTAGNSQVRQVQNEARAEMRQRFGFLSKITNIFKR